MFLVELALVLGLVLALALALVLVQVLERALVVGSQAHQSVPLLPVHCTGECHQNLYMNARNNNLDHLLHIFFLHTCMVVCKDIAVALRGLPCCMKRKRYHPYTLPFAFGSCDILGLPSCAMGTCLRDVYLKIAPPPPLFRSNYFELEAAVVSLAFLRKFLPGHSRLQHDPQSNRPLRSQNASRMLFACCGISFSETNPLTNTI